MSDFTAEIENALRRGDDRAAFVQADRSLSCREVERLVSASEQWIRDRCDAGDRVAALTSNRIEAVILEWAAYRAECIWLGIPARERDLGSLQSLLSDFTPRVLMLERFGPYTDLDFQDEEFSAREIPPPPGIDPYRFRTLERSSLQETEVRFSVGGQAIRRLRYSSGSSGDPKAVAYSDRTLSAMLSMIAEAVMGELDWTVVHALPITWASGSLIVPALCRGGKNVILGGWDLDRFVHAVAHEEDVLTLLTPAVLAALTRYSEATGSEWARGLRRVLLAGGPTPVWTMRRAWRLFGRDTEFFVTLGQTEASFPITWHRVSGDDVAEHDRGPALVPLGRFTKYYRDSKVDRSSEILLVGDAVAAGIWEPKQRKFESLAKVEKFHRTGDRAEVKGRVLHYLGRVTDPWREDYHLPSADAIEAVLNECPGVRRSRVDGLERGQRKVEARVTVQPSATSLRSDRLRAFFDDQKRSARLGSVALKEVSIGEVALTLSGKIKRAKPPADPSPGTGGTPAPPTAPSGSNTAPAGDVCTPIQSMPWHQFDLSLIASGPLYFYVGAGLSTAAGLASWGEQASLIWSYLRSYEKRECSPCPANKVNEIETLLDDFVRETVDKDDPRSAAILSREAGEGEPRTLGRAALLNLLIRYRGPRVRLRSKDGQAVPCGCLRPRPGEEPSVEDLTVHSMIWRSRCHGVFTTNYDMLLEHAFSLYHHGAALRTYRYTADYLRFLLSNPHFVLKLHGDINDIASMEFRPRKAWSTGGLSQRYGRGEDLKHVYRAALDRGHMIYLGCGFRDETVEQLHRGWEFDANRPFYRIALLPDRELSDPATADQIGRTSRQGIEFLTVGDYGEIRQFMEQVVDQRASGFVREGSCPEASDIHRQIFLSLQPTEATRSFTTQPWSCRGIIQTEPQEPSPASPNRRWWCLGRRGAEAQSGP